MQEECSNKHEEEGHDQKTKPTKIATVKRLTNAILRGTSKLINKVCNYGTKARKLETRKPTSQEDDDQPPQDDEPSQEDAPSQEDEDQLSQEDEPSQDDEDEPSQEDESSQDDEPSQEDEHEKHSDRQATIGK